MSTDVALNNKRIVKNTLMLYIRMLLVMLVSIYTSRVFLKQLGVSDYGIYNVVGTIVSMLAFLNSSLSASTQRFITFTLGKGNKKELHQVFAASFNIHLGLAIIIAIIMESVGVWYINNLLVAPPDRLTAANWVFQFAVLTSFLTVTQVPYTALINAHEDMSAFAWLSIFDVFLKLGVAFLIGSAPFDRLIYFALLLLIVQVTMISIYRIYCTLHYEEAHIKLFYDKPLYKSITSFAGWTLIGGCAWTLKNSGANILLNFFFGPIINSARGVALQVTMAVNNFSNNFLLAVYPQITKYYVQNQLSEMHRLCDRSLKFSFFIVFVLALPIMLSIDFILSIWLVEVPDKTDIFIILVFIESLIQCLLGSQLVYMVYATGKIRNMEVIGGIITIMILPFSFLFIKMGYGPETVFVMIIIFGVLNGLVRLYFAHKQTGYSYKQYLMNVFLPTSLVTLISVSISIPLKIFVFAEDCFANFLLLSIITLLSSILSVLFLGMTHSERATMLKALKAKMPIGWMWKEGKSFSSN